MTGAGSVSIVQYLDHAKDTRLVELNFEGMVCLRWNNVSDASCTENLLTQLGARELVRSSKKHHGLKMIVSNQQRHHAQGGTVLPSSLRAPDSIANYQSQNNWKEGGLSTAVSFMTTTGPSARSAVDQLLEEIGRNHHINQTIPLLVLEFFPDRDFKYPEMTFSDLYHYVKHAMHDTTEMHLEDPAFAKFPKLSSPDIRKLDDSLLSESEPLIASRQNVILVNMDILKAIILRDRCLLLLPIGADEVLEVVMEWLQNEKEVLPHETDLEFEFLALETIMESVIRKLDKDFKSLSKEVLHVLALLRKASAASELEQLRNHKNDVATFDSKVHGIISAIARALDDDQDLCLMHITKFWREPSSFRDIEHFDHEDAEILLESYLQEFSRLSRQITLLKHEIDDTEQMIAIRLTTGRERLFKALLLITLVSIALTVFAAVGGIFGEICLLLIRSTFYLPYRLY